MISPETSTQLLQALFLVAVAGVAAIFQYRRHRHHPNPLAAGGLAPWRTSVLNFILWLWVISCVFTLAGSLPSILTHGLPPQSLKAFALSAVVVESVLFITQILLLSRVSFVSARPLDGSSLSHSSAALEGFLDFLIALPFICACALLWQELLDWFQRLDPSMKMPLQDPVALLRHGGDPWLLAVLALVAIVLAPVNEELFFRGGLYRFIKGRCGRRTALVASSLLFGLVHNNLLEFLPLVLIGALLVRTYERTGRILASIVFHASFNAFNILLIFLSPTVAGIPPSP